MRILIAEDDLDISNLYKKALEKNRHQVVLTSNGSDCLTNYLTTLSSMASKPIQQSKEDANKRNIRSLDNSSAKANDVVNTSTTPYDVVILDYSMPGMNGMEVAKEILNADPHQRIIFASAYVRDTLEHSVKELKRGTLKLIQKPFTLKQLTDTVEDTLAFDELKGLNVDVDRIKGADLTHAQIFDLLARLRRIQKNRTF